MFLKCGTHKEELSLGIGACIHKMLGKIARQQWSTATALSSSQLLRLTPRAACQLQGKLLQDSVCVGKTSVPKGQFIHIGGYN